MLCIVVIFSLVSAQSIQIKAHREESPSALSSTASGKTSSEDSFLEIPNVNTAGGTNRTRYLQVRGLGETSVYETTPSHSVGFWIEDIDVTGLLATWSQQNIQNLKVHAGPQSVSDGGFASAGIIKMQLNEADTTNLQLSSSSAQEYQAGAQLHPLKHSHAFISHRQSSGFYDNAFTKKPGTQQNEVSSMWKQRWVSSPITKIRSAHIYQSQQNLYDVWSLDNSYVTQSDRQGEDALQLHGHSLNIEQQLSTEFTLSSTSSFTNAQSVYSYDADWAHSATYDYFDWQARTRQQWHQKVFLKTQTLSVGTHIYGLQEKSDIKNYKKGLIKNSLLSDFTSTNAAVVLQKQWVFANNSLSFDWRQEWQTVKYSDSNLLTQKELPHAQAHRVQWSRPLGEDSAWALRWSQGFKNSGFNVDPDLAANDLYYGLETTQSYEFELSGDSQRLTLFYQKQDNAHLKISQQSDPNDPSTFFYRTTNTGRTDGWGLEYSGRWSVQRWSFESQIGLLKTQFRDYTYEAINYRGRDLAHAPRWNYATSAKYDWPSGKNLGSPSHWSSIVSINGRDAFYYSNNHQQKSSAYSLFNLGMLYQTKNWDVALWIKNVANTRTTVRGFYFANEPPNFPVKLYEQLGPPRHILLTANYRF